MLFAGTRLIILKFKLLSHSINWKAQIASTFGTVLIPVSSDLRGSGDKPVSLKPLSHQTTVLSVVNHKIGHKLFSSFYPFPLAQ